MSVKLLTEHHLKFLRLKGGCAGSCQNTTLLEITCHGSFFVYFRCAICMCDFVISDTLRILPCMHSYHKECIDDWLMRSFTCPSCMEPVDAALLCSYETG